jgi:uncharacterized protein (TIGR02246 family)
VTRSDFDALFARWRAGDAEGAVAYFTPDGVFHEAQREPLSGRAALVAHWAPYFRAGPEWRMTVHDVFGEGERFAVTYTWEVRAAGGGWSGRPGCAIVRTRGGKIAEWREYKA